jgi:hypothetical protein
LVLAGAVVTVDVFVVDEPESAEVEDVESVSSVPVLVPVFVVVDVALLDSALCATAATKPKVITPAAPAASAAVVVARRRRGSVRVMPTTIGRGGSLPSQSRVKAFLSLDRNRSSDGNGPAQLACLAVTGRDNPSLGGEVRARRGAA